MVLPEILLKWMKNFHKPSVNKRHWKQYGFLLWRTCVLLSVVWLLCSEVLIEFGGIYVLRIQLNSEFYSLNTAM